MNRRNLAHIFLPLTVLVALLLYLLAIQDRLPEQVATHWGGGGAPDGFSSRESLVVFLPALGLLVTALLVAISRLVKAPIVGGTELGGIPLAMAAFIAAVGVSLTVVQLDGAAPAQLPWWSIPAALAAGAAGLLIGGVVHGRPPPAPESVAPAPVGAVRYPVAEGDTVIWTGVSPTAQLPVFLGIGLVIMGLGLSTAVSWWLLLIFAPLSVLVVSASAFTITIGPAGLRVAARFLGFPRVHIPLAQIQSATPGTVQAMAFGGWGIRVGLNGESAVITKSGPALVVTRTDGAVLRVSLDQPEEAASVLSSLLDRRSV